ncbi:hypothetical protein N7526_007099 [Penicillium atrosanguineum]|nr:hypothetical protein N7526_007099 [Penicillium atrosanguineum]
MTGPRYDHLTQAFLLGMKVTGKSNPEICALTGVSRWTLNKIFKRALKNGFDPDKRPFEIDIALFVEDESNNKKAPSPTKKKKKKVEPHDEPYEEE